MRNRKSGKCRFYILCAAAAVAVVVVLCIVLFGHAGADRSEESKQAIKRAVMEKAMQCYVIEGAFPENITYLEDHYGLLINHDDYYIEYKAVAENYPPQIIIAAKNE